ncbi:MAG: ABC transporter substrate-binding protein [Paralcaligenes sp.]
MSFILFPAFLRRTSNLLAVGLLGVGLAGGAHAEDTVNPNGTPSDFIQAVGDNALNAIKKLPQAQKGDVKTINQIVNHYVLPYVNLQKTTSLSAGRYWRQATPTQQQALVQAFKGTLIRTYSGAFTKVTSESALTIAPFRGDPKADDVVVRSTLTQGNAPSINIDYRLEKAPQGWKIYDLNVEGIWLIQNYRNQFADQISRNGIDGLIQALNQHNQ